MKPNSLSMRLLSPPNSLGPSPFARPAMPRGHSLLQDIVREFDLLDYCHASTVARTIAIINLIMRQVNKINTTIIRKL